jgi:SAM-dependent methyltransferase
MLETLVESVHRRWLRFSSWMGESPSTRNPALFLYQVKKRGVSLLFGSPYQERFYEEYLPVQQAYTLVAQQIQELFAPTSACDFGCGNGYILARLHERGVRVAGVEGSAAAIPFLEAPIKDSVQILDLAQPVHVGTFDLVISTEVAEHLPKKAAASFVANLTSAAERTIVFSAAPPGQWGDGHINCQPKAYWIDLFERQGWKHEPALTEAFIASVSSVKSQLPWIGNFAVFSKNAASRAP